MEIDLEIDEILMLSRCEAPPYRNRSELAAWTSARKSCQLRFPAIIAAARTA
jgi:hypothetical protein